MSLQAKLDELKRDFETNIAPPEVVAGLHRAIDELIASGAPQRALKAGDIAPEFTLPASDGALFSSRESLRRGPLVVSFYRGVWCPYCNLELAALEEARGGIEARGAILVAISQQTQANSRKIKRDRNLQFPILSDKGGLVTEAFKVRWTAPEYLREIHRAVGADLTLFNQDDSWTLAMPSRFIINRDGVIVYSDVNADYTRRPEPEDIYPVLDQLAQAN